MIRSPPRFDLRPLTEADLPLLHRWLNAPHVRPWYGGGATEDDVAREYLPTLEPASPIHAYIAVYEGRPIGMLSWERMGDSPDFQRTYGVSDPDSANCDLFIGEVDTVHRGLGAPLLREFLARVVFADPRITTCIIDPQPENTGAIRAYEKAGFRFLRVEPDDGEGNAVTLMELRREALFSPPA